MAELPEEEVGTADGPASAAQRRGPSQKERCSRAHCGYNGKFHKEDSTHYP